MKNMTTKATENVRKVQLSFGMTMAILKWLQTLYTFAVFLGGSEIRLKTFSSTLNKI